MQNQRTLSQFNLSAGKIRLLRALSEHPFLSRRQLELYLHTPLRTIRHYLHDLMAQGSVQRHNARQPWMHTRSLLSLTPKGIEQVAAVEGILPEELVRYLELEPARLERLIAMMERSFQVRTFLLWLQQKTTGWEWSTVHWDVEIGKLFSVRDKGFLVPFHGGAVLASDPERSGPERLPSRALSVAKEDSRGTQGQLKDGRWTTIVVEWDLGRVPVEKDRERLVRFVAAQNDPRYWGSANEEAFPVWVIIAQDEFRLQDYYTVIRAASLSRQLPMPRAYLTTFLEVAGMRTNLAAPIWYSTISGGRTSLLSDIQGCENPLPTQAPWRRLTLAARGRDGAERIGVITPQFLASLAQGTKMEIPGDQEIDSAAAIALLLNPREKRILDEVADHPLLAADEIALMLRLTAWQVREGLKGLAKLGLTEGHSLATDRSARAKSDPSSSSTTMNVDGQEVDATKERFALTHKGMRYLAVTAGFGNNLKRYAKARGWLAGLSVLIRHWEHTHEENAVFLALAQIAQRLRHELIWLSELESRLYYSDSDDSRFRPRHRSSRKANRLVQASTDQKKERRKRHHSFLPDGRGTYIADGQRYEFALEIDRGRSSRAKFRRKLIEYYACITSNILRGRGIELLRLLIVTHSWERAETLRELAVTVERELQTEGILPIFITTFSRLRATGAGAPIWLKVGSLEPGESALTAPKTYCFDCFSPKPAVPRKPGLTIYSSG